MVKWGCLKGEKPGSAKFLGKNHILDKMPLPKYPQNRDFWFLPKILVCWVVFFSALNDALWIFLLFHKNHMSGENLVLKL